MPTLTDELTALIFLLLLLLIGVDTTRIVYANPCKAIPEIRFAKERGVPVMTFDNAEELHKLKQHFSDCQLLLRIRVEDSHSHIPLGMF